MIIWEIIIYYILIINTYDIPAVPGQAGGSFMRKSTPKFKNQFAYRTLFLHQHANFRLFATTTCNSSIIYYIYYIYKQHYNQRVVLYNIHNINNIILIDCIPNSFSQDRSHSPKNNLLSPNLDLLSTQVVCLHVWLPTQFFRPKRVCQNHRKTSDRTGVNPFSWTFAWWLFKQ